MIRILFVCNGNVFRSLTAEYAFRQQIGNDSSFHVSSAGVQDRPELRVREDVATYLLSKGLDVSTHRRRTIDDELVGRCNHVIAMNVDNQKVLNDRYQAKFQLFTEASGGAAQPLPDIDDLFAPSDWYGADAIKHIKNTIDTIINLTPSLINQISLHHVNG